MNKNSIRVNSRNSLTIFSLFILLFSFVSCSDMFQDKIPFPNNDNPGTLDDLFKAETGNIKLSVPAQFYAAPFYSSTEIRLTWTGVRYAAYYMIERAEKSPIPGRTPAAWEDPLDEDFEILDRFVYGTSYTDEILKIPSLDSPEYRNRYYYRVSAFNTAQKFEESNPSTPVSAMLFRAPVNLRASSGSSVDYVDLRWDLTEGAVSYEVFRSELSSGVSASSLGTVLGNQNWFRNWVTSAEQGKDFFYFIIARNGFNNRSLQTRPAYGYARVFGAPDAPVASLAPNSGRGHSRTEIKITWTKSDEPDVYYAVYRYNSADSSLTRLTGEKGTTATEWTDTQGLRPGIYYYYRVQAITYDDLAGRELKSEFSSPDPEGFILSSPETVVAEKSAGGTVTIKWLPPIGNENERQQYTYNVYSAVSLNGDFTIESSGIPPVTDGQGYISAEVLSVSNTFFRVSTVKGSEESALSGAVSPAPAAAIILGATQHAYIANAQENASGVYPVLITWKKPENEEPAFYHVQRSTRTGSGFSRINETALGANGPWSDVYSYDPSTETYTYTDKNEMARVGRKYYYRILSLNQLEQGNFPSDERIGWGALSNTQYMLEYNKTMKSALKKLTYMHRPGSTDKLGTETKNGTLGGTIYYNAALSGLGARIIIRLTNYADFYIENEPNNGVYFTLNGESNTSANMSANGTMDGIVTASGMYPGRVRYDRIEIRGGNAGGGTYGIWQDGFPNWTEISWTVGEQ